MTTLDEKRWWLGDGDDLEPLMGVPGVAAAPAPLPDVAPNEPEPGVAAEQVAPAADDLEERDDPTS